MTEPILTEGDLNSGLWQRIKLHMESELLKLRIKNDSQWDELKTAFLRGHIECLKRILALGEPGEKIETYDHLFKD